MNTKAYVSLTVLDVQRMALWVGRQLDERTVRKFVREHDRHCRAALDDSVPSDRFVALADKLLAKVGDCVGFPDIEEPSRQLDLFVKALWEVVVPAKRRYPQLCFRQSVQEYCTDWYLGWLVAAAVEPATTPEAVEAALARTLALRDAVTANA